tara:strand:- start:6 stop:446 length:441 start_codon:yes stop_codon:yes gene_type:complete
MAGSVNKVILIGNLGKDPEIRHLDGGRGYAKFSIATSESYKDKSGQKVDQTEWHNIAIWRPGLVELTEKYLKKGNKVYVEGKLRTRSWEDEQKNTRYMTEIVVDQMTFLSTPNTTAGDTQSAPSAAPEEVNQSQPQTLNDDDDLPF